jgi:hypothetical protein
MQKMLLVLWFPLLCLTGNPHQNYPIPAPTRELLFYVQRSINTNTLVYELNLDKNGVLNSKTPVRITWINYEKGREREPLNFFQRTLAYGIEWETIDATEHSYRFRFVSYQSKYFYLLKSKAENRYRVYTSINKETADLRRIYVEVEQGISFFSPNIHFVRLEGINPVTGKETSEIIHP